MAKQNKVKLKDLLNPFILNEEWVGFNGDSEYFSEDGEVKMGNWTFLDIIDTENAHVDSHNLDDEINESELSGRTIWKVKNDNGTICTVQFIYADNEELIISDEIIELIINHILDIQSKISHIHKRNICLDDYKSNYMHIAQDLNEIIDCNLCMECDNSINSLERIENLSHDLINLKENVIDRFLVLMNLIEELDCELRDFIGEQK